MYFSLTQYKALRWISLHPFSISSSPALWVTGGAGVWPSCLRVKADTFIWLTGFTTFALESEAKAKIWAENRAFSCLSAAVVHCVCLCHLLPPAGVLMSDSAHLGPAWWVGSRHRSQLLSLSLVWRYAVVFAAIMQFCVTLLALFHVIQHLQMYTHTLHSCTPYTVSIHIPSVIASLEPVLVFSGRRCVHNLDSLWQSHTETSLNSHPHSYSHWWIVAN